ncbi:hypothetical protein [Thiocapsa bogorovii]|uniref:hypothetical protein n=1 Tax=Thiocapsa bogorovii TaxID=521689 RepID=UPI001E3016B8|nr:hypothetical protein [Thiocapsa bogorovii]UHD17960.1 hypothetical protein LT988_07960 [Thiocapsa bogorovii]
MLGFAQIESQSEWHLWKFLLSICFVAGLMLYRFQNANQSLSSLLGSAIIFIPVFAGAWFTTAFTKFEVVTLYPQVAIAASGLASVFLGYIAHFLNLFENKLTNA